MDNMGKDLCLLNFQSPEKPWPGYFLAMMYAKTMKMR